MNDVQKIFERRTGSIGSCNCDAKSHPLQTATGQKRKCPDCGETWSQMRHELENED